MVPDAARRRSSRMSASAGALRPEPAVSEPFGAVAPAPPPALVTYAGSEPLLASPFCAHVLSSLGTQLPVPSVPAPAVRRARPPIPPIPPQDAPAASGVWHPAPPPATLAPLHTELVELGTHLARVEAEAEAFITPSHALSFPLAHLYLLVCDDAEHYRTSVREDIHRWHNVLRHTHGLRPQPSEVPHNGIRPAPLANAVSAAAAASATAAAAEVDASSPALDSDEEPEWLIVLIAPVDSSITDAAAAASSSGAKRLYSSFQKSSGSVAEKLRADFGSAHVVQLTRLPPLFPPAAMGRSGSTTGVDPGMFADLIASLRTACARSLQTLVTTQESILAKAEAVHHTLLLHADSGLPVAPSPDHDPRNDSGNAALDRHAAHKMWDFSGWMLAKDYLARTFLAVGMLDDAWLAYSQVDTMVSSAAVDRQPGGGGGHAFFFSLGGIQHGLDASPTVLDPSAKPYREMLQRNRMTLYDCRVYLFASRAKILGQMGGLGLVRLLGDTDAFLPGLVRSLTARQTMPKPYLASWQYTNSLHVVRATTSWWEQHDAARATQPPPPRSVTADLDRALGRGNTEITSPALASPSDAFSDPHLLSAFRTGKALLLGRARAQLEVLGTDVGLLPSCAPFAEVGLHAFQHSLGESGASTQKVFDEQDHALGVKNEELVSALRDEEAFDGQYVAALESEMAAWMQARKTSFVLSLRARVACLALVRQRYSETLEILDSLIAAYAQEGVHALVEEMLVLWLTAFDALSQHTGVTEEKERKEESKSSGKTQDTQHEWIAMAVRLLNARSLLTEFLPSHGAQRHLSVAADSPWRDEGYVWERLRAVAPPEDQPEEAAEGVEGILPGPSGGRQAADSDQENSPRKHVIHGFSAFTIKANSVPATLCQAEDGALLPVRVCARLGQKLKVDEVRLHVRNAHRPPVWFTSDAPHSVDLRIGAASPDGETGGENQDLVGEEEDEKQWGAVILQPGQNTLSLFAPAPPTGRYVVDKAHIIVGPFLFEYDLPSGPLDPLASPTSGTGGPPALPSHGTAQLVNIPEDGDAVYATLTLPEDIVLDAPRLVELTLSSGRNHINTAEIALKTLAGENIPIPDARLASVDLDDGVCVDPTKGKEDTQVSDSSPDLQDHHQDPQQQYQGQDEQKGNKVTHLTAVEGAPRVQVHDLPPRHRARLLIPLDPILKASSAAFPHSDEDPMVHVRLHVDYITRVRPRVARILRRRVDLRTALPLGVSVQDFFLLTSLFSKFVVLAGGTDALRVRSARLASPRGVRVWEPPMDQPTVVTPTQPASFVFRLDPIHATGSGEPSEAPLGPLEADEPATPVARESGGTERKIEETKDTLELTLYFRSLTEEARLTTLAMLERQMDHLDPRSQLLSPARKTCLRRALGRLVENRLDASRYALTGEIWLGVFSERAWHITCDRWGVSPDVQLGAGPELPADEVHPNRSTSKSIDTSPNGLDGQKSSQSGNQQHEKHNDNGDSSNAGEREENALPSKNGGISTIPDDRLPLIQTERQAVLSVVRRALEDAASGASTGDQGAWHRLILAVERPRSAVVSAVEVKLGPGPLPLLVGVPRAATITVRVWTGWAGSGKPTPPSGEKLHFSALRNGSGPNDHASASASASVPALASDVQEEQKEEPWKVDPHWELAYEVLGGYDTWLISGDMRGTLPLPLLTKADGKVHSHTLPVQLVPVKHGALLVPGVSVSVRPRQDRSTTAAPGTPTGSEGWDSANGPSAQPTYETWQADGAKRVEVVPRRSRATFWVDLPNGSHWSSQPGTRFVPV